MALYNPSHKQRWNNDELAALADWKRRQQAGTLSRQEPQSVSALAEKLGRDVVGVSHRLASIERGQPLRSGTKFRFNELEEIARLLVVDCMDAHQIGDRLESQYLRTADSIRSKAREIERTLSQIKAEMARGKRLELTGPLSRPSLKQRAATVEFWKYVLSLGTQPSHKGEGVRPAPAVAIDPVPKSDTVEPGPIKSFIVDARHFGGGKPEKLGWRVSSLPGVVETRWGPDGSTEIEVVFDATLTSIREIVLAIAPSKADPVEPASKADPVEPAPIVGADVQWHMPTWVTIEGRPYRFYAMAVGRYQSTGGRERYDVVGMIDGKWQHIERAAPHLDEALFKAARWHATIDVKILNPC